VKILLTNYWFNMFSGSELVTLELYKYFSKQGHDVEIYTNVVSEVMKKYLKEKNVHFSTPSTIAISDDYDLVWVHQQTIPLDFFEKNPRIGAWIFHHMSPFEPLEFPLNTEVENTLSRFVLANSKETAIKLSSMGIEESKVLVFDNPAPKIFFEYSDDKKSNSYFLFISNHPPKEAVEAMKILSDKGEKIVHIGRGSKWAVSKEVTPFDIAGASVVISIGKTIQYSIAMKKTFYIYDHFGGDGFIESANNFKENSFYNFSGRNSHNSKGAEEIASDLLNYKFNNPFDLKFIGPADFEIYNLEKRIENIFREIDFSKKQPFRNNINPQQVEVFRGALEIIRRSIMMYFRVEEERTAIFNSVPWRVYSRARKMISFLKRS